MATKKILTDITSDGSMESTSFIKTGGTSSQFLKADGSVDSNDYVRSINLETPDLDGDINLAIPSNTSDLTNDSGFISATTGDWTGTLDGQEGSYYLDYNNFTNTPTIPTGTVDGGGTAGYVPKWSDSDTLTDSIIRDTGSAVGIGKSPSFPLDVNGAIAAGGNVFNYGPLLYTNMNNSANGVFQIGGNGGTSENFEITNNGSDTTLSYDTSSITMKGSNVGIGTASPTSKLHVAQDQDNTFSTAIAWTASANDALNITNNDTTDTDNYASLYMRADGSSGNFSSRIVAKNTTAGTGELHFQLRDSAHTANTETKLMIDSGGNVGIGTNSPSYKLEVDGTVGIDGAVSLLESGTSWNTAGSWTITPDTAGGANYTFGTSTDYLKAFTADAATVLFQTQGSDIARITTNGVESSAFIKTGGTSSQFLMADGSVSTGGSGLGYLLDTTDTLTGDLSVTGRINVNTGGLASVGILGKAIANGWAARYDSNDSNYSGFYFDANNDASLYLRDDAGNANVLVRSDSSSYFNGGNVGIGTTSPQAKLDVEQSNSSSNTVFLSNSYNNKGIRLGNAGYGTISGFQDSNSTASGTAYGLLIGLNTFYNGTNFSNDNQYVDPSSILFRDGDIRFHTNDVSASGTFTPTERVRISKTGNVGIGTTSPECRMHIKAPSISTFTGTAEHQFRVESDSTNNYFTGIGFAQGTGTDIAKIAMKRTSSGSHLYFGTSNNYGNGVTNSALVIDHNGLLGMGVSSPSSAFGSTRLVQMRSTGNAEIILDHTDGGTASDIGALSFERNGDHLAHIRASHDGATDAAFIAFHAQETGGSFTNLASNENMRITSSGRVGIGATNPLAMLDIEGMSSTVPAIKVNALGGDNMILDIYNSSDAKRMGFEYDNSNINFNIVDRNTNKLFTVREGGNIGINDDTPSYKLDVAGTIRATGDVIAYSDERVKENIETIKDATLKVSMLRGVEFNKIGEEEKSIGVIAQEVEEVIPEVVKTDDEGMKAVAYGNLVGLLIESNKDLIKRIEKLERIINNK